MKKLIIAAILLTASTAFSAGYLQRETGNTKEIQGFAPNGLYSAALTVNSTTYDLNSFLAISIYAPADCKIRLMATSSKAGSVSEPILGGQWNTIIVNKATPFANVSGCTSGYSRRM